MLAGSANIEAFLQRIVEMVAEHVDAAVCSIYIYEDDSEELVLKATTGLNPSSIGQVRLHPGEGLVGHAFKDQEPICEPAASQSPRYKHFTDINEEPFDAFLAVPIIRGIEKVGVLVVRRESGNDFTGNDVMAMRATASQLASHIENARILMALRGRRRERVEEQWDTKEQLISAKVAAEGLAMAEGVVFDHDKSFRRLQNETPKTTTTLAEFQSAVARTEEQLEALQASVGEQLSDVAALIFEAHIFLLKDTQFTGKMVERIEAGADPTAALLEVASESVDLLIRNDNAYMREKAKDVEDLAVRLYRNLVGDRNEMTFECQGRIVITRELYPSEILKLSTENVAGIIMVSGGVTSHVSILANSLQIPMVIADNPRLLHIPPNVETLLDAAAGRIFLNPSRKVVREYEKRFRTVEKLSELKAQMQPETRTLDGTRIRLMSNINLLVDVNLSNELKSEGVGLYRTEFPFMIRADFPTEEEQLPIYRELLGKTEGQEVTIRTLDIGGDKVLAYYDNARDANPHLGMRSIRFALTHPDIFKQQTRAILRAGADRADTLRIMFPMVSSIDDFRQAKVVVNECIAELKRAGLPHHKGPSVGMMVEIPSVVEIIDDMAKEADFFCIGTNDFIQFMLAVDRANEKVASYYLPHHPAVLRSLKRIAAAAARHGKDISVCGEMAHEARYVPFFIGIGIRTLSLAPRYLPHVQQVIMGMSLKAAEEQAEAMLRESTIEGVTSLISPN